MILDEGGIVLDMNSRFCKCFGIKGFRGKKAFDLTGNSEYKTILDELAHFYHKGQAFEKELELKIKEIKYARLSIAGTSRFTSIILKDISKEKGLELKSQNISEQYRIISEITSDYFYKIIPRGRDLVIDFITGKFKEVTGYEIEEIKDRKKWSELIIDIDHFYEQAKKVLVGKTTNSIGFIKTKQGKIKTLQIYQKPIYKAGKIIGFVGSVKDITAQMNAEDKLFEATEFNKEIVSNAGSGIQALDKDLRYLVWNKSMERIIGYKESEVLGKKADESFPNLKDIGMIDLFKKVLLGHTIKTGPEYYQIPRTGKKGWLSSIYTPYRNSKGEIVGIVGIVHDITEQKNNEEKIKKINDNLELEVEKRTSEIKNLLDRTNHIMNSIDEMIISVDSRGTISGWNTALERFSGIKKSEIIGRSIREKLFPDSIGPILDLVKRSFSLNKRETQEIYVTDMMNNKHLVSVRTYLIYGKDASFEGAILIGNEISHQKELDDSLSNGGCYYCSSDLENLSSIIMHFYEQFSTIIVCRNPKPEMYELKSNAKILVLPSKHANDILSLVKLKRELIRHIQKNKPVAIVITDCEYFKIRFGFEPFMKFVYEISDIISKSSSLFILNIDLESLELKEKLLIKKEFKELNYGLQINIFIDKKKREVLKYIKENSGANSAAHCQDVGKIFKISRLTTKRWLSEFQTKGLVNIEKYGRMKNIRVTEKGKQLLAS